MLILFPVKKQNLIKQTNDKIRSQEKPPVSNKGENFTRVGSQLGSLTDSVVWNRLLLLFRTVKTTI